MIRFRQIHDLTGDADQRRFAEAVDVFRAAFPFEAEGIEQIRDMLLHREQHGFDPVLLVSTDKLDQVTGIAFVYYFSDLRCGYLQYIASDPRKPARGIGTALYEALRETLGARGARGLFLDVPPGDPAKLMDKSRLAINRRRLRLYARYGVYEVAGTHWDSHANPRNDGYLTTLLFDPLGRQGRLERAVARRVVRRILVEQFGFDSHDPFVIDIARSFRDDPVRLVALRGDRPPKARPPAILTTDVAAGTAVTAETLAASSPATGAVAMATRAAPSSSAPRVKPTTAKYLAPLKVVVVERHAIHHLREKGYVERPVRVGAILNGLTGVPYERVPTRSFAETHLTAVHDPTLVSYLRAVSQRLDDKAVVYPEVFPIRRPDRVPRALEDRAGYFCADTFTPLTKTCYRAARDATNVALTAAQLIETGDRLAYALCRPPGHHAERRIYGGFCYFNNSGIAAHYLSRLGPVALLDIDYHHGNGAQDIFYERADVYTVSIHGHPRHAYPNFSGYADERGEGAGRGFNHNFPLEAPVDSERYLGVLDRALALITRFRPRYLVVSLGFDIMAGDPTGAFAVNADGLNRIGRRITRLGLPTLFVQEGGYSVRNLRIGSEAFFEGAIVGALRG